MITEKDILAVRNVLELNSLMDQVAKEHNCILDNSVDYEQESDICRKEADFTGCPTLKSLANLLKIAAERFEELDK